MIAFATMKNHLTCKDIIITTIEINSMSEWKPTFHIKNHSFFQSVIKLNWQATHLIKFYDQNWICNLVEH